MRESFISRDEQDFHIIDNPVRKDKVFGLPYIASTSWKGSLRALWQQGKKAEIDTIRHLFRNEKETEKQERFRAGRLYFFPTFFNMKNLEIPHQPIDNLRYNLLSLRQYRYAGGQRPWRPHHHPIWQAHTPRHSNR